MKKTIKISLQGTIFYIDEDAYTLLQQYLTEIGDFFKSREEAGEIIQDIETRIAEIFTERLEGKREVVSLPDVEYMISVLGRPAEIFEEQDEGSSGPQVTPQGKKRFFRDPDNAVLGGVCGGLGAYFNIDPVWFRILFILLALAYGSSLLIYLILWIVLPEARTSTQRLEMQGTPVNINNISKNLNNEINKVKKNIKDIPHTEGYRRTRNAIQDFFHVLGQIFLTILKIIAIIIGVVFIFTGLILITAIASMFFFHYSQFLPDVTMNASYYLPDILKIFAKPENIPYIIGSLLFTLGIPLIALVYAGIRIIFNIRTRNRVLGVTVFVLWLISTISLSLFIADIASNYSEKAQLTESISLNKLSSDTLYITASAFPARQVEELITLDHAAIFRDRETGSLLGRTEVDIVHSGSDRPEVEIYRRARGNTRDLAVKRAEKIHFHWVRKGNYLFIDPWFGTGTIWYGENVKFKLRLPEGMIICLDDNLRHMLDYIPNEEGYHSYNMTGKCWIMTPDGLKLPK